MQDVNNKETVCEDREGQNEYMGTVCTIPSIFW